MRDISYSHITNYGYMEITQCRLILNIIMSSYLRDHVDYCLIMRSELLHSYLEFVNLRLMMDVCVVNFQLQILQQFFMLQLHFLEVGLTLKYIFKSISHWFTNILVDELEEILIILIIILRHLFLLGVLLYRLWSLLR